MPVGSAGFEEDQRLENMATVTVATDQCVRGITIAPTMAPVVHLELTPTLAVSAN